MTKSTKKKVSLAEYQKIRAPAWAEYTKIRAPAWAEYTKICDPAWTEYNKIVNNYEVMENCSHKKDEYCDHKCHSKLLISKSEKQHLGENVG